MKFFTTGSHFYPGFSLLGLGINWRRYDKPVWGIDYCLGDAYLSCGRIILSCQWPWVAKWVDKVIWEQHIQSSGATLDRFKYNLTNK